MTYEQVLEMFRQTDERMARMRQEADERMAKMRQEADERDRERAERDRELARERAERARQFDERMARMRQESEEQDRERARKFDESMAKMRQEAEERARKFDESMAKMRQETERQIKAANRSVSRLGNRVGELVEAMVEGNILRRFQKKGYTFTECSQHYKFSNHHLDIAGEVDLFLENDDCALLIEVKLHLSVKDIRYHMARLAKYRQYADVKGDKRRFLAAVGGGVISDDVLKFAVQHGLYVIRQSGDNVEIIDPEGEPKIW